MLDRELDQRVRAYQANWNPDNSLAVDVISGVTAAATFVVALSWGRTSTRVDVSMRGPRARLTAAGVERGHQPLKGRSVRLVVQPIEAAAVVGYGELQSTDATPALQTAPDQLICRREFATGVPGFSSHLDPRGVPIPTGTAIKLNWLSKGLAA